MRQRLVVGLLALAALGSAESALAIPAFARRYKVECHFCHDGYPKLNTIGQRFKERGFRMEREDAFDGEQFLRSVPVVLRAHVNRTLVEDSSDSTFGYFKGISAGNLGSRVSYWVDDSLLVGDEVGGPDDDTLHVKPDNAWARFEIVRGGKLYLKGGRFEMDLPFTQSRTPHLFSYDVYFANTGFETDTVGDYQEGVELGGDLPGDGHWSAAVVKGRNSANAEDLSDEAGDFDANLFLRLAKRFNRNRLGAFAYIGRNTLATSPTVAWDDNLLRLGADANVWLRKLNLYGVYMYGSNDNSIATPARPEGTEESLSFNGGFLQADYHVRDEIVLTLRFNLVSRPPGRTNRSKETLSSLFPGLQVFLFEHLKLSFEYGFLNQKRPSFGAAQAEVAF